MKKLAIIITITALGGAGLIFSGCDIIEPTPQSDEEKFMEELAGIWTPTEITLDGVVIENAFDGFELTIDADKTFTTKNGNDPIWESAGTFTLVTTGSTPAFDLLRDDATDIEIVELDETTLVLAFTYVSDGGRKGSVSGEYVFELER